MALTSEYHVHSNYSDGRPLTAMLEGAEAAGLEAIGFTDHCNVSGRDRLERAKREFGFNIDLTYRRRRTAFESLRDRFDLTIYDAVELDYDPRDEAEIAAFLAEADFDYVVGSVHALDGTTVFDRAHFEALSEAERRELVDTYYERVGSLIESELFDVVAHVDVLERTPPLRGYSTSTHYESVATALEDSRTLPELNAGAIDGYGSFHPAPVFLETLRDRGIRFVPGTDAHRPGELAARLPALAERFADAGLEPATPFDASPD